MELKCEKFASEVSLKQWVNSLGLCNKIVSITHNGLHFVVFYKG